MEIREEEGETMVVETLSSPRLSFCMQMLKANRIPGILPFLLGGSDNKIQVSYPVTGFLSLKQYQEEHLFRIGDLRFFSEEILHILEKGKEYLLNPEDFHMEEKGLWIQEEPRSLWACYCDGYGKPLELQLEELFGAWMHRVNGKDKEAAAFSFALYQNYRSGGIEGIRETLAGKFPLGDFPALAIENVPMEGAITSRKEKQASKEEEEMEGKGREKVSDKRRGFWLPVLCGLLAAVGLFYGFGKGALIFVIGMGALILWEERKNKRTEEIREEQSGLLRKKKGGRVPGNYRLLPMKGTGDPLIITGFPYLIGKKRDQVDGRIEEEQISGLHAELDRINGSLYLTDLAGAGTRINGALLEEGKETPVKEGDLLTFGKSTYRIEKEPEKNISPVQKVTSVLWRE